MSARIKLQQQLFPQGIPKLWCPTLSFFSAAGQFDVARLGMHLERLSPYVKGILVPGSTGEGWEMTDGQILDLLEIIVPKALQLKMHVLVGILKTETEQVMGAIDRLGRLLEQPAVVGITVCPPKGSDKTQDAIRSSLARVLQLGIPTALYQLPQVTQNEMSPETFLELAAEYANFIMFKDTSGEDRITRSLRSSEDVFMVRGSEKSGYSRWLRACQGGYDGFLLSTANCFARQLNAVIELCESGRQEDADRESAAIGQAVEAAFEAVSQLHVGNAFTNANKALDHLLAHGDRYCDYETPMLISGTRLPIEVLHDLKTRLDSLDGT